MAMSRKQLERLNRQQEVAKLYLMGLRPLQIADRLNVSQRTVIRDLEQIKADWQTRATLAYDQWISDELARLDSIEQEARNAWEDTGNHQFLRIIGDCIKQRRELLGLDKPRRMEVSGPGGGPMAIGIEDLTDEQLMRIAAGGSTGDSPPASSAS